MNSKQKKILKKFADLEVTSINGKRKTLCTLRLSLEEQDEVIKSGIWRIYQTETDDKVVPPRTYYLVERYS